MQVKAPENHSISTVILSGFGTLKRALYIFIQTSKKDLKMVPSNEILYILYIYYFIFLYLIFMYLYVLHTLDLYRMKAGLFSFATLTSLRNISTTVTPLCFPGDNKRWFYLTATQST